MARHEATIQLPETVVEDPALARTLFNDVRLGWVWLAVRLYVGWQALEAGWAKLQSPEWMSGGTALRAHWERVVEANTAPGSGSNWYRHVLGYLLDTGGYTWAAKVIAIGETFVAIALLLGLMTGVAATLYCLASINVLIVGAGPVDPLLPALAVVLVLAWKTAGWIGLDRWLLPVLGTPWRPGLIRRRARGRASDRAPVGEVPR